MAVLRILKSIFASVMESAAPERISIAAANRPSTMRPQCCHTSRSTAFVAERSGGESLFRDKPAMRHALSLVALILLAPQPAPAAEKAAKALRPPAVPLVACDPYFSIWSPADKLTDAATVHWTGKAQRLTSLVRIDGKVFRLMGKEPEDVPAIKQTAC